MQQRQLRLGDILDDYCPRERRLTNHVVVAMVGTDVKQTRCTTCDADHEYKHARAPRPRRKAEPAALYAQNLADAAPKRVVHGTPSAAGTDATMDVEAVEAAATDTAEEPMPGVTAEASLPTPPPVSADEGPVHRTLIRAQLPRIEGQPPQPRQAPDFTIRQPGGRQNRFRPRQSRGGQGFQGNRSNGNMANDPRGGSRPYGNRSPQLSHHSRHHGPGKRSK